MISGAGGKDVLNQVFQLGVSVEQESRDLGGCDAVDEAEDRWAVGNPLGIEKRAGIGGVAQDFVEMDIGYCSCQTLASACTVTGRTEQSVKCMNRQESVNHSVEELE